MVSMESQLKKLIDDCKRLLKDMDYYHEVPSSTYFQNYIHRKIQQLQWLLIMVTDGVDGNNIATTEEVYRSIKAEVYVIAKKWKLAVESRYRHQKSRMGKLYYISSLG